MTLNRTGLINYITGNNFKTQSYWLPYKQSGAFGQ